MRNQQVLTLVDQISTARTKAACCAMLAETATTGGERTNLTARAAHWRAEADRHHSRLLAALDTGQSATTHAEPMAVGAVRDGNGGGHIEAHGRHRDDPSHVVITRYTPHEAIATAASLLICANDIDPTAQEVVLAQVIPPAPFNR